MSDWSRRRSVYIDVAVGGPDVVALALVLMSAVVLGGCGLVAVLAGRSSYPRRERLPVSRWRVRDVTANLARGRAQILDFTTAAAPPVSPSTARPTSRT